MKKTLLCTLLALPVMVWAGVPDSVWVRPVELPHGGGMLLEWSSNGTEWKRVTEGRILGSDYGAWGREKKMYAPSLAMDGQGLYALVFQVNDYHNQFGVATTRDFIHWRPQDYPIMPGTGQCLTPVIRCEQDGWTVTFHNKDGQHFTTRTIDLAHFSAPQPATACAVADPVRMAYAQVQAVADNQRAAAAKAALENELARDNETRFAGLKEVKAEVHVEAATPKSISDKLMGIFFEDINYSADGGLNAQLVQNGDFEYIPHDRGGDQNWNTLTAWEKQGSITVEEVEGVSLNNSHAICLSGSGSIANKGFDGIVLKKGAKYNLSLYLRGSRQRHFERRIVARPDGDHLHYTNAGRLRVELVADGKVLVSTTLSGGKEWRQVQAVLTPKADATQAELRLTPVGEVSVDMVSLIPQDTYKGHGLRRDLAETLAALKPTFMRFPGGCVAHGDGLGNIYNWKETIGPLKDRKPARNLWGYHQSRQIGYYEFFQMCEDMGMEPLPVLAAGVPCQNSSDGGQGQMGGIPMEQMPAYVQDVLDLIEWANGDASTTWGRKRAEQGHKKPFNLKYIGIGNEDLISPTFEERYLMICKAVKAKYPDIRVCGTAGPFFCGSDYEEGWRIATQHKDCIDLVDEHYYVAPGWYIYNHDYYDQYDRSAPKVYLGEWAAHGPGRKSTIETALSEALHFCALERNGDVVEMSSYAPLLAKDHHTQWNPDMIYFNNTEVKPTVGYQAQKMCGQSQGDQYLPSTITTQEDRHGVRERLGVSTVRDSRTGKTWLKLVNILPCEVDAHLLLNELISEPRTCKTTILTGNYDSTTALPAEGTATLSGDCHYVMPPYSFTLIEL